MDKKAYGNLDPKLREAYEKVMGTKVTPPAQTPPSPASRPEPSKPQEKPAEPSMAVTQPVPQVSSSGNQVISYNAHMQKKEGGKQMPVVLLVGLGIVFLLLYTIVWAKIIGVKLPLLPF